MRALDTVLLLSVGCSSVGCDASDPPEDGGVVARGATREDVETTYYTVRPSCPSYSCGLNSPFIGHELNLEGDPNDELVEYLGAHHQEYGAVTLEVRGDELVADVGASEIRGDDLVGLTLELQGEVGGDTVPLTVKLVEAALVPMWTTGAADIPPLVPSYKFVYASPGIDNQLLCPSPKEGAPEDPKEVLLAKKQAQLFDAGALEDLRSLNESLEGMDRPYHTVLFAGERFDYDTAEIYAHDEMQWFNWGCAGSSAAKLHLTGHTTAADARAGFTAPTTPDLQQAMLYAYTATYCPGAPRLTVPGHPIRLAEARGVLDRDHGISFAPRASGTVEALWGPTGAKCLSVPRLETDGIDVWSEIAMACPSIPACADRASIVADDEAGVLLDGTTPVITFNLAPDSCQGRCATAGPGWDCTPACVSGGTCSSDYADLCP